VIPASKESCINYQSLSKWCEIGIERSQHPNICTKLVTQFTAKDHPLCVCVDVGVVVLVVDVDVVAAVGFLRAFGQCISLQ
jgi:hypothetical protein